MRSSSCKGWLPLAALAVFLLGCSRMDRFVRLSYEPPPRRPAPSLGVTIGVGVFEDRRTIEEVGYVRPSGEVTARAYAWGSVTDWVEEALAQELMLVGFDVVRASRGESERNGSASLRITGEVLEVQARLADAISAEVRLRAILERAGEVVLDQTYRGHGGVIHVLGTGREFSEALSKALSRALGQLVADVKARAASTEES